METNRIDTTKIFPVREMTGANNYMTAFSFMVGTITARERLDLHPLSAKELLQLVYDNTGVLPIDSIVKDLGLRVKESSAPEHTDGEPLFV